MRRQQKGLSNKKRDDWAGVKNCAKLSDVHKFRHRLWGGGVKDNVTRVQRPCNKKRVVNLGTTLK